MADSGLIWSKLAPGQCLTCRRDKAPLSAAVRPGKSDYVMIVRCERCQGRIFYPLGSDTTGSGRRPRT